MKQAEFAGNLRERIRIERRVIGRDALAAASGQSQLVGEFWVMAEAVGSGDEAQAESRAAMQRWRFALRETDTILPGDIVIWNGRSMIVQSVLMEHRPFPKTILLAEEKR